MATVYFGLHSMEPASVASGAGSSWNVQHPLLLVFAVIVGILLMLPAWIALIASLRHSCRDSDGHLQIVESPLLRRSNGARDWKPIQYEQIANREFINAVVDLDGKRYINCTFRHCTFRYEGAAPTEFVEHCRLIRDNPNEPNFVLSTNNPLVTAAWMIQHRIAQGGPGIVAERFEPTN